MFLAEKQQGRGDAVPVSSSSSQEEAAQRLKQAKTGSQRAMQRPRGLTQLTGAADLPVSGLRRAKWLNPSVVGA